jgi:hypothetical protein
MVVQNTIGNTTTRISATQRHNLRRANKKIREKRAQETTDIPGFPVVLRKKPTAHKQYCFLCRNLISKSDSEIVMESGFWCWWLKDGKKDGSAKTIRADIPLKFRSWNSYDTKHSNTPVVTQRKIYLHTDCYACIMNKVMMKHHLHHLVINSLCDKCRNRFNCFTGNVKVRLENLWQRPTYIPNREITCDDEWGV